MKTVPLVDARVYRAYEIEYYATVHSTIGSRKRGGRFNRPGVSALYLALDADTALAEYWQFDPPRPLVLIPHTLTADFLLDVRGGTTGWPSDWLEWDCDWKVAQELIDNGLPGDCASWRCGDDAIRRKVPGIVFPSTQRVGGANVVLFTDHLIGGGATLDLLDPKGEIRKANQPILT